MPRNTDHIKKGAFLIGYGSDCQGHFGHLEAQQPLCHVYKQQQQPSVSLDEIAARIEAATAKVAALRASLQARRK